MHLTATLVTETKSEDKITSTASKTLKSLKIADRLKLGILYKNVHAVIKHNIPLRDYKWLCELDVSNGLNIKETYLNEKAALNFMSAIAVSTRNKTATFLKTTPFCAFMMDGTTDIFGNEQEAIYIRTSKHGKVSEHFLVIGNPSSTSSKDLLDFVLEMFTLCGIDTGKLVAMESDGAANMVGRRFGLAALIRENINSEEVLEPLMRLSLKLQRPEVSIAESVRVESAVDLVNEIKERLFRDPDKLLQVITTGKYQSIDLHGRTPTMAYKDGIINGFVDALNKRFQLSSSEKNILDCSKLLHLKNWPSVESDNKDFAVEEVTVASSHFYETLKKEKRKPRVFKRRYLESLGC